MQANPETEEGNAPTSHRLVRVFRPARAINRIQNGHKARKEKIWKRRFSSEFGRA